MPKRARRDQRVVDVRNRDDARVFVNVLATELPRIARPVVALVMLQRTVRGNDGNIMLAAQEVEAFFGVVLQALTLFGCQLFAQAPQLFWHLGHSDVKQQGADAKLQHLLLVVAFCQANHTCEHSDIDGVVKK